MENATCQATDCEDAAQTKGLCNKHYLRKRKHGSADYRRPTVEERFWAKVDKNGPVPAHRPELGPCWLWTSPLGHGDYAFWDYGGRRDKVKTLAHRFAYELSYGAIPTGLHIDHLCRVRHCIRANHLEAVTQAENNRRAAAVRPRVTHCPQGHEYTPENARRRRSGAPACRACQHARQRVVRQLKRRPPRMHCPQGHPFSSDNVYVDPDGHRECRICRRLNFRAWYEKNRKGSADEGGDARPESAGG